MQNRCNVRLTRRPAISCLILGALLLSACRASDVPAGSAVVDFPLLPLERLMATASFSAPLISPDGERIAWVAPHDGVPNYFVAEADDIENARPVTRFTDAGVRPTDVSGQVMYRWHYDSQHLLFPRDYEGDENFDLYIVDTSGGEPRNLTPRPEHRVALVAYGRDRPNEAMISVETFGAGNTEIHHLDLLTGETTLRQANEGFLAFLPDNDLEVRLSLGFNSEGGLDLLTPGPNGSWSVLHSMAEEDIPAFSASSYQKILRIDRSNKTLFLYDSAGRDTAALVGLDLETGDVRVIAANERVDVGGVLYHPVEGTPRAIATNWSRTTWTPLESAAGAALADDFATLTAMNEGDWQIVSQADDDAAWIVQYTAAHRPTEYFLYERGSQKGTRLFSSTPQLEGLQLSDMHPYVFTTADGFELVSYVTLPPWTDPDGDGRPDRPVPTVVYVHGGPSDERAQYGFGPLVHWLANRGYAFLYVNFRGSAGFGKSFMNAQRHEWGGKMHTDVVEQVDWAIAEGIAEPGKVAVLGGSYGGYAALVGMTMTPEVFACGVDIVGPSNLEIFMPHWDPDRMGRIIGDPRTEEGRALLRERSPINFAHQTRNPVLIGQGANDSRVPQEQSDSIVEKMSSAGAEVTYVVFPDEGHGFAKPNNSMAFFAVTEAFFGKCLGGRQEPLGEQISISSMKVPVGAEHIPGLADALERRSAED